MANTFKLVTKANVTSSDVIYTPNAVTTVILGLILGNTTSSQVTSTVSHLLLYICKSDIKNAP